MIAFCAILVTLLSACRACKPVNYGNFPFIVISFFLIDHSPEGIVANLEDPFSYNSRQPLRWGTEFQVTTAGETTMNCGPVQQNITACHGSVDNVEFRQFEKVGAFLCWRYNSS